MEMTEMEYMDLLDEEELIEYSYYVLDAMPPVGVEPVEDEDIITFMLDKYEACL